MDYLQSQTADYLSHLSRVVVVAANPVGGQLGAPQRIALGDNLGPKLERNSSLSLSPTVGPGGASLSPRANKLGPI